jgi:hypothetical protein
MKYTKSKLIITILILTSIIFYIFSNHFNLNIKEGWGSTLPSGSWKNSCKEYSLYENNTKLKAKCKTTYNTYRPTDIVRSGSDRYKNDNGKLKIE